MLFVVITNAQGIRLSHPNCDELGRQVSTDPTEALAGHEVAERDSGILGHSVCAKVPVRGQDSARVVAEVSVGSSAFRLIDQNRRDDPAALWHLGVGRRRTSTAPA